MKTDAQMLEDLEKGNLNSKERLDILFNLISNYFCDDAIKEVREFGNQFLELSLSIEYPSQRIDLVNKMIAEADLNKLNETTVRIFLELGSIYRKINLNQAHCYFKKAKAMAEELDSPALIAESYNDICFVYNKQGDYSKSIPLLKKSLEIGTELDSYKILAKANTLSGEIYYNQGAVDKALFHYLKTLELDEEFGAEIEVSRSYNNLGTVYYRIKDYKKAQEFFSKSLKIKEKNIKDPGISFTYNNLGAVAFSLKQFTKALEFYKKSLQVREKFNDIRGQISVLSNIGGVYYHLAKLEVALEWFNKAYDISLQLGDKRQAALIIGNMSMVNMEIENFSKAIELAKIELELAEEIGALPLQESAFGSLFNIYEKMEDYKNAFLYHTKYKEICDEINSSNSKEKIAELQTKYDLDKKEKENEIYRLKNIELVAASETIRQKNQQLENYRDNLILINKILRHDLVNNLTVLNSAFRLYKVKHDPQILSQAQRYVDKSFDLIAKMRNKEDLCEYNNLRYYDVRQIIHSTMTNYPELNFKIQGNGKIQATDSIFSVFDNLLSNAITHGEATCIDFKIDILETSLQISVSDNGKGIPEAVQPKVFEEGFVAGTRGHTGVG